MAGATIGAMFGGESGAASGLNATANNYLTAADLRSRQQKLDGCRKANNPACEVKVLVEYDMKSAVNTGKLSHSSIGEKLAMEGMREDLQQLLNDPSVNAESKSQARKSIAELNVAINVIEKFPVLRDAAEVGLIAADIVTLGELAAARVLTTAVVKEMLLARTGREISTDQAARIANNFYAEGASSAPVGLTTSAGIIPANPNKTTTVLGRWEKDMSSVIEVQMQPPKSSDFGARPGGFNVLNVSKAVEDAAGKNFFEKVNKAFLDEAVKRGDDLALATIPLNKSDLIGAFGELRGNFAHEVKYLVNNNIRPKNVSPEQWATIKRWFE